MSTFLRLSDHVKGTELVGLRVAPLLPTGRE